MGLLSNDARQRLIVAAIAVASVGAFAVGLATQVFTSSAPADGANVAPHALPGLAAEPAAMPGLPGLEVMVGRLEAKLARGDGTAEQWRLLGQTYVELGRDADARTAFARAEALERGR